MLSNHQKVVGHVPPGPTYGNTPGWASRNLRFSQVGCHIAMNLQLPNYWGCPGSRGTCTGEAPLIYILKVHLSLKEKLMMHLQQRCRKKPRNPSWHLKLAHIEVGYLHLTHKRVKAIVRFRWTNQYSMFQNYTARGLCCSTNWKWYPTGC